jgi:uncharacterized membrane protein YphA (DoxX/SURF4 family)
MPSSQALALLTLRVALGLLMLVWGADKLANPAHGAGVAAHFYFGLGATQALMPVLGALQLALGACVAVGAARRVVYPALLAVTGVTLVGVWRSVVDPWGWYLDGTNALFFPSVIVFAGALVVWAFRAADGLAVDAWWAARAGAGPHPPAGSAARQAPRRGGPHGAPHAR